MPLSSRQDCGEDSLRLGGVGGIFGPELACGVGCSRARLPDSVRPPIRSGRQAPRSTKLFRLPEIADAVGLQRDEDESADEGALSEGVDAEQARTVADDLEQRGAYERAEAAGEIDAADDRRRDHLQLHARAEALSHPVSMIPAIPAESAEIMLTTTLIRLTGTPVSVAACSLPPIANA
jgi:hypothetical protein